MTGKYQTPKGFRDFLPEAAWGRNFLAGKIIESIKKFGFEPLETPALEYTETLKGKYGEEEKLIFEFTDRGGREVGLRYDQTVPLARVISANPNLPKPFKRYQAQPVWRADNPQKGRFREFVQVDFDTVGESSRAADAEVIVASIAAAKNLGFEKFTVKVNDRENFSGLPIEVIRAVDKLQKVGESGVIEQIKRSGYDSPQAKSIFKNIKQCPPTQDIQEIFDYLEKYGVEKDKYAYDPTLARGLDYYTGVIYELEIEGYDGGSAGSGGRYDSLIDLFGGGNFPAVGFSFGIDRLLEAAKEQRLIPKYLPPTKILVTILDKKYLDNCIELATKLRDLGIATEISLDAGQKIDKQVKYADNKPIPYVAFVGEKETKEEKITLKDLATGKQEMLTFSELKKRLLS